MVKTNEAVMRGLATVYMQKAEEYIHSIFQSVSRSFPEGLVYIGYERLTPEEEYYEVTKVKNNKRLYDLAKSDLYMVRYKFTWEGEPLPDRYVYLPYVGDAGIMHLGGVALHLTPVLSDKVITPLFDSVFVRLVRDRMIFKRKYHPVVVDGVRESSHVIWSQIHRNAKDKNAAKATNAETCIAHYLFARYGFSETFRKYAGFVPVTGGEEINENSYPNDCWVICMSSFEDNTLKPKTVVGEAYYPTKIRMAIPKDKWNTITKALVMGFYYTVDNLPDLMSVPFLDIIDRWKVMMGVMLFSADYRHNKLIQDVTQHYASLDDCLDPVIVQKLEERGYYVQDIYDLMALILSQFNKLILDNSSNGLSMYGKNLEILYYVLYDITAGIVKVNFRLSKKAQKLMQKNRKLTSTDIIEAFNKEMKPGAIFGLSNGKIVAEPVSYSGDHMYFKITSKVIEQESSPAGNRGRSKRLSVGEDKHADVSMMEAGSMLFLSKSNPTPTNHINPFIILDMATATIMPNPKFAAIREEVAAQLKGKLSVGSNSIISMLEDDYDNGLNDTDD
jgi:hypothetical protein